MFFFYSNLVLWLWLDDLYDDNSKSPEILFCFVFILLFLQLGSFRSAPDVDVVCGIVKNTIVKESLIKQKRWTRSSTCQGFSQTQTSKYFKLKRKEILSLDLKRQSLSKTNSIVHFCVSVCQDGYGGKPIPANGADIRLFS